MPPDGLAGIPDKPEDENSAAQPQYTLPSREGNRQIAVSDHAKAFSRNQDPKPKWTGEPRASAAPAIADIGAPSASRRDRLTADERRFAIHR
jgi:hypothetical protein